MWTLNKFYRLGLFIPLLWLCHTPRKTEAAGQTELYALMDYLFTGYKPEVRPFTSGESTYVYISLRLLSIQNLDEKSQVLETSAVLDAVWLDDYLSWDPASYGGIETFVYPQKKLWLPDIVVANSVESQSQLGYDQSVVRIYSDGIIRWFPSEILKTSCDIDVTYYPFDTQECSIIVTTWQSTYEDIDLDPAADTPIDLNFYSDSGTWDLKSTNMVILPDHGNYTRVKFSLKLRRLRTYYVMNIILPVLFLSFCASMVFYLPADAGEKIGMSITVLLAYAVYLTIIAENMPQTSLQVSILSVYLNLLLGLTASGVVMSVMVLHFHHKSEEIKIGKKTKQYTRKIRNLLKMNTNRNKKAKLTSLKSGDSPSQVAPHDTTLSTSRIAFVSHEDKKRLPDSHGGDGKDDEEEITWQKVAETVDRAMFYFTGFCIAFATILFISILAIGGLVD